MIPASYFVNALRARGFGLFCGVPCSYLTPLINTVITAQGIDYIGAANEGDAVAIAAGAEIGGVRGVVLFQNSGLGNAVNPFTSLTETFRLPVLVLATWRGQPGQPADEPQHERMGQITPELFELMGIPTGHLPEDPTDLPALLDRADAHLQSARTPFAIIISKGAISGDAKMLPHPRTPLPAAATIPGSLPTSLDLDPVLDVVQETTADDAVIATTGFTGRSLYARGDRDNQFYMVGSMGCASSFGFGLARVRPERRVVVLDGDGAMLMRLSASTTIGFEAPPNLVHVLLDNEVHDSTGSQATVSPAIDFASIARACGYRRVLRIDDLDELRAALADRSEGLTFIHVRTAPRADRKLPRPTITPPEVAERFARWIRA